MCCFFISQGFFFSINNPTTRVTANPNHFLFPLPAAFYDDLSGSVYATALIPFRPSDAYPLTRSHHLPICQNHRVDDLPADQTFPSPVLLMGSVKFVIDHGAPAAKTFRKKHFFHWISS
jgi:hypothetical protein